MVQVRLNRTKQHPWSSRIPKLIWRGTVHSHSKARMALIHYGAKHPDLIDAGYLEGSSICANFEPNPNYASYRGCDQSKSRVQALYGPPSKYQELWDGWRRYKYHLAIDGHSSCARFLYQVVGSDGVILFAKSEYELWFESMMQPWVHYVPVHRDLSNLVTQLRCAPGKCVQARPSPDSPMLLRDGTAWWYYAGLTRVDPTCDVRLQEGRNGRKGHVGSNRLGRQHGTCFQGAGPAAKQNSHFQFDALQNLEVCAMMGLRPYASTSYAALM